MTCAFQVFLTHIQLYIKMYTMKHMLISFEVWTLIQINNTIINKGTKLNANGPSEHFEAIKITGKREREREK